jgi:hypothetical protein
MEQACQLRPRQLAKCQEYFRCVIHHGTELLEPEVVSEQTSLSTGTLVRWRSRTRGVFEPGEISNTDEMFETGKSNRALEAQVTMFCQSL